MKPSEGAAFRQLLEGVYSFYRQECTTFHAEVWWQAMKGYSYDAVKDAFNRHVMNPDNGQFLPKPADVVKLVDGGTQDRALVAWSKVELAVSYVGSWKSVVFDDAIIHAVIDDLGGWIVLCGKSADEWPFVRNEFVNRYRAYAMKPLLTYPAKLYGRADSENSKDYPHLIGAPMFIGDEAKARAVMQRGAMQIGRTGARSIGELAEEQRVRLSQQPSQLLGLK